MIYHLILEPFGQLKQIGMYGHLIPDHRHGKQAEEHARQDPSEEGIDYVNIVCYDSFVRRPTEREDITSNAIRKSEKSHENGD